MLVRHVGLPVIRPAPLLVRGAGGQQQVGRSGRGEQEKERVGEQERERGWAGAGDMSIAGQADK